MARYHEESFAAHPTEETAPKAPAAACEVVFEAAGKTVASDGEACHGR